MNEVTDKLAQLAGAFRGMMQAPPACERTGVDHCDLCQRVFTETGAGAPAPQDASLCAECYAAGDSTSRGAP